MELAPVAFYGEIPPLLFDHFMSRIADIFQSVLPVTYCHDRVKAKV